jgi:hypothetical protein
MDHCQRSFCLNSSLGFYPSCRFADRLNHPVLFLQLYHIEAQLPTGYHLVFLHFRNFAKNFAATISTPSSTVTPCNAPF